MRIGHSRIKILPGMSETGAMEYRFDTLTDQGQRRHLGKDKVGYTRGSVGDWPTCQYAQLHRRQCSTKPVANKASPTRHKIHVMPRLSRWLSSVPRDIVLRSFLPSPPTKIRPASLLGPVRLSARAARHPPTSNSVRRRARLNRRAGQLNRSSHVD